MVKLNRNERNVEIRLPTRAELVASPNMRCLEQFVNELANSSGGDALGRKIDKFNNEIGIKHGLQYPLISKTESIRNII